MPGSGGASVPVTTPGNVSTTVPSRRALGRAVPSAPAAHNAERARLTEAPFERARGRERLDLVDGRARTAYEVFEVGEDALRPFVVDAVEQRVVQAAHAPQPEPDREVRRLGVEAAQRPADRFDVEGPGFEGGIATRRVEIGTEHLHAVTARVAHDRVR